MVYENIKKLCSEKGISIAAVEKEAGIGNGVIGGWREGSPRVDSLMKVANVLGTSLDELVKKE